MSDSIVKAWIGATGLIYSGGFFIHKGYKEGQQIKQIKDLHVLDLQTGNVTLKNGVVSAVGEFLDSPKASGTNLVKFKALTCVDPEASKMFPQACLVEKEAIALERRWTEVVEKLHWYNWKYWQKKNPADTKWKRNVYEKQIEYLRKGQVSLVGLEDVLSQDAKESGFVAPKSSLQVYVRDRLTSDLLVLASKEFDFKDTASPEHPMLFSKDAYRAMVTSETKPAPDHVLAVRTEQRAVLTQTIVFGIGQIKHDNEKKRLQFDTGYFEIGGENFYLLSLFDEDYHLKSKINLKNTYYDWGLKLIAAGFGLGAMAAYFTKENQRKEKKSK
jgi:hypothetical protein